MHARVACAQRFRAAWRCICDPSLAGEIQMRTLLALALALIASTALAQQSAPTPADNPPAFVNGKLDVPGVDPDGPTVPSKFSERNAKVDAIPIMAHPLPLTSEQRQRIYQTVMQGSPPSATVGAEPAQQLPAPIALGTLPEDLVKDMPILGGMSALKSGDKLLIVRGPTSIVMDEITP
jgi:hypothetical protein